MVEGTTVEPPHSLRHTEEFNLDEVVVKFLSHIFILASCTINWLYFFSNGCGLWQCCLKHMIFGNAYIDSEGLLGHTLAMSQFLNEITTDVTYQNSQC